MQITKNTSNLKRATSIMLVFMLIFSMFIVADTEKAFGKTLESAAAENVFFYVKNNDNKNVLLKVMTLEELTTNLVHNNPTTNENYYYSYTDNLPTTGYAEARGFTLMELLDYVKSKTAVTGTASITYTGNDTMRFMATDSFGRYSRNHKYCDLYGIDRYYFPELYNYWNSEKWETEYGSADNAYDTNPSDPKYHENGKDTVFISGEKTDPILATTSESGRTISDLVNNINANKGAITGCLV
ncbi:MAG: hypothetical protein PHE41_08055, partial [Eubacteriales bacterium]|nr:hypothetical protein [Eubacteriales bacterium]